MHLNAHAADPAQVRAPAGPTAAQPWRWPRNRIEAQLKTLWERELGVAPIPLDQNFFDLGGDTQTASRLMRRIERAFDARLPAEAVSRAPTVALLAEAIADRKPAASWDCLVPLQPLGAGPPLFCMHNYNGEVWLYVDLARRLAPDQPVYGIQAVGVNRPCLPLHSVERMASRYIREIQSVQPHGPYFLGGMCFGAYLSFEVARQLAERGEQVGLLLSFDTFAYDESNEPKPALSERIGRIAAKLDPRSPCDAVRNAGTVLRNRLAQVRRRAGLLSAQMRMWSGKPLDPDARRELFTTLNGRARVRYRPRAYPGTVTLIRALGNREKDPKRFLGGFSQAKVECVPVEGDHLSIIEGRNVQDLADKTRALMSEARERCVLSEAASGRGAAGPKAFLQ